MQAADSANTLCPTAPGDVHCLKPEVENRRGPEDSTEGVADQGIPGVAAADDSGGRLVIRVHNNFHVAPNGGPAAEKH